MRIQVRDLTYTYAPGTPLARLALRGVSLQILPGERVGILGHTGSGKSTLIQHMAGLLEPASGGVWLDGVPAHARTAAARARRRRIGLAFQYPEDQFFEQTVFREVAFGPRTLGLSAEEIDPRVRWALGMVGIDADQMAERAPFALSGGEMRRVALASILALRPAVLILDEPTAGLDPQGRRELMDRLQAWHREENLTLILVSHEPGLLARLVDRVVVLREGRVAADGPARRVLSDGAALRAAGLDPPAAVTLLQQLQAAGWPVRADRLLPEEAAAEIARTMGVGP